MIYFAQIFIIRSRGAFLDTDHDWLNQVPQSLALAIQEFDIPVTSNFKRGIPRLKSTQEENEFSSIRNPRLSLPRVYLRGVGDWKLLNITIISPYSQNTYVF